MAGYRKTVPPATIPDKAGEPCPADKMFPAGAMMNRFPVASARSTAMQTCGRRPRVPAAGPIRHPDISGIVAGTFSETCGCHLPFR